MAKEFNKLTVWESQLKGQKEAASLRTGVGEHKNKVKAAQAMLTANSKKTVKLADLKKSCRDAEKMIREGKALFKKVKPYF